MPAKKVGDIRSDSMEPWHHFSVGSCGAGLSGGVIAGVSVGAVVLVVGAALFAYTRIYRKKRMKQAVLLSGSQELSTQTGEGSSFLSELLSSVHTFVSEFLAE